MDRRSVIKAGCRAPHYGLLALIVIFAASACLGGAGGAARDGLPESKKNCGLCHLTHDGAASGQLRKPVPELCAECHPERTGAREHVVDVVPSMTVTGLPLLEGKITCATCHDPHSNRFGNLLRMPPAKLCRACHRK